MFQERKWQIWGSNVAFFLYSLSFGCEFLYIKHEYICFCHTKNSDQKCSGKPGIQRLRKAYEKVAVEEHKGGWKTLCGVGWRKSIAASMSSRQLELGSGL